jgi:ATP-dependent helicase/nuclease subunit B
MSVTSFRKYLESPYLFYLERVLGLRSRDDRARELDPRQFGNFAHDVLQAFGLSEVRDALAPDAIEGFLVEHAARLALERFGPEPLPAIGLQLEQLKYRFRRVAAVQARWRAEGWRILRAEWKPEGGHPFEVDGEPMLLTGKLDRIDVHEATRRFAVLDYKTGEVGVSPEAGARDRYGWKDLQLPLYRLLAEPLAREHGLDGPPVLGFFHLGKDEEHIGLKLVETWSEDTYVDALLCAADVVRRVRRGEFFELVRAKPFEDDWIFRALVGKDLLHAPFGAEGDEEEGA